MSKEAIIKQPYIVPPDEWEAEGCPEGWWAIQEKDEDETIVAFFAHYEDAVMFLNAYVSKALTWTDKEFEIRQTRRTAERKE